MDGVWLPVVLVVLDSESPAASTRVRVERPPLSRTQYIRPLNSAMIGQPPFYGSVWVRPLLKPVKWKSSFDVLAILDARAAYDCLQNKCAVERHLQNKCPVERVLGGGCPGSGGKATSTLCCRVQHRREKKE